MFDFEDFDLECKADELRENYNLEDRYRLEEDIESRIEKLEEKRFYADNLFSYQEYLDIEDRISKLGRLRDSLHRFF